MAIAPVALAPVATRTEFAQGVPPLALQLARLFHGAKFSDVPATAVKYSKIILASTLASAAAGTKYESAHIVRDLSEEQGGAPEATVWFDGAKLPLVETARVNAILGDAAASDDSD